MFICHALIVISFKTQLDSVSDLLHLPTILAHDLYDHLLPVCLSAWSWPTPFRLHYRHLLRCWNEFRNYLSLVLDAHSYHDCSFYDHEYNLWNSRNFPMSLWHHSLWFPLQFLHSEGD